MLLAVESRFRYNTIRPLTSGETYYRLNCDGVRRKEGLASKRPVRHVFDNVSLKATIVTPFSLWQVSFMYKKIPPRFLLSTILVSLPTFQLAFYFSIFLFFYYFLVLVERKMGYLHMLAHLSSCVISWKQRKNR